MVEGILTCSCSGVDKKATDAFSIIIRSDNIPELYRGKDAVRRLADKYPNTNLDRYLRGITKKSGRWAYYLRADANGDIAELWDLLTGRRVG